MNESAFVAVVTRQIDREIGDFYIRIKGLRDLRKRVRKSINKSFVMLGLPEQAWISLGYDSVSIYALPDTTKAFEELVSNLRAADFTSDRNLSRYNGDLTYSVYLEDTALTFHFSGEPGADACKIVKKVKGKRMVEVEDAEYEMVCEGE